MNGKTIYAENERGKAAGMSQTAIRIRRYTLMLFLVFVLLETILFRRHFLWKLQELDLFAYTASYLTETLRLQGGLLRYVASFFTQFFYLPWLGTLLYIVVLLALSKLVVVGFSLKRHLYPFSFIPSLTALLSLTELGYEASNLHVQGYAFVVPFGTMALIAGFIWYRRFHTTRSRTLFLFAWTLLAYPFIGVYALMGTLLMLVYTVSLPEESLNARWLPLLAGLCSIVLVPLFNRNVLFAGDEISGTYTALLPAFAFGEAYLWLPYIVLSITLLALIPSLRSTKTDASNLVRMSSFVLFTAILLMVHLCGNRDHAFYNELAMERACTSEDWQQTLELSGKAAIHRNAFTASYTDLSRFKLGLTGKPAEVTLSPFSGALISYEYGKVEAMRQLCMNQAASNGMNVHVLKYLTLAARSTGYSALAAKYVEPLKNTLFHRKWAMEQALLIDASR